MDVAGLIGSAVSAAKTLNESLNTLNELVEKLLVFGYESELVDLQRTVENLTAVLHDAETKQELSQQAQVYIQHIKDVFFDADDLMDELVTLARQQRVVDADGSLREKLSQFFSRSNPICVSYWMSRGVKDIKKKLDAIAYDKQFSFQIDHEPTKKRRPETCSYVNENKIIGRQDDLESIVGMLLGSDDQRDVSVLSIVGIGGLGKTALAQLVYNNARVKDAFPLRMWTCVSDQDQKVLNVKNILLKILASITHSNPDQGSTMDQVQSQLRVKLAGKKYLLILDDVWTEKRHQWCQLADYLNGGERGSWILVTTRSKGTATITGGQMHELLGLSKENSWRLFERAAFASDQPNPTEELVMIGKQIVDGCRGVPLAIRVAGSLLYGQDKSKWRSVQNIGLANIRDDDNEIMPILKLSFHHLETQLKNCFRYCAMFPKDYEMEKKMLIRLWMAQGYIVPLDKHQTFEDTAEEYFSILTRRCFFQDIEKNARGEIWSCKIHDLMHDIAQSVTGEEICLLDSTTGNVDKHVRHLSISNKIEYEKYYSLGKTHIRSLLFYHYGKANCQFEVEALVGNYRCLRVLDLSRKNIKHLPDSIGDLLHLRYLDLSYNRKMEALPNSITKLCNLQTLLLCQCGELKELPKEFGRLVNLRVLDIYLCDKLTSMPRGMGKLTCLHTLRGGYRVGGGGSCTSWEQWFDGLRELKKLVNLKGRLQISMWWPNNAKNDVKEDRDEGLYLSNMKHVNEIDLAFKNRDSYGRTDDEGVTNKLMKNLRPHSNLETLEVHNYHGVNMPGWVTLFPNLVYLCLFDCKELKYLPCLGNLCHLKTLWLQVLSKLEYIEVEMVSFFPSLNFLFLRDLPKFKGWRIGAGVGIEESSNNSSNQPHLLRCHLPQLKILTILNCPELTCIMVCPMVEDLGLNECNRKWQIVWETKAEVILSEDSGCKGVPKLGKMNNVSNEEEEAWLNWKPMESFHSLRTLTIAEDDELVELPSWMQYLSALQTLEIWNCNNLKAMPNWMPKLTSLKRLGIYCHSEILRKRCQKDPPGEDWPYIQHIPNIYL